LGILDGTVACWSARPGKATRFRRAVSVQGFAIPHTTPIFRA
jgi:hypothetical protein